MKIAELSRLTGASVRSLRYYEEKDLLSPTRAGNGYRDFDYTAVERVRTIRFYFSQGLGTEEVAKVIDCPNATEAGQPLCPRAIELYRTKLSEIEEQIALLTALRDRIRASVEAEGKSAREAL